jgi:hypothetical protein
MDTYEISKERYLELLNIEAYAAALDAGGVDNWDFFDEALSDLEEITEIVQ